ncbi:MAG: hypothetical protein AAGU27_06475 [Dehalobacterium sp.]
MKKAYEKPLMEIVEFEVEDTITASGLRNGGAGIDEEIFWWIIQ